MPNEGYYKINPRKLSFREVMRLTPNPALGLLTWLILRLRLVPPQGVNYFPYPSRLEELRADPATFPPEIREPLEREISVLSQLGFFAPVHERLEGAVSSCVMANGGAHLRAPDGRTVAFVHVMNTRIPRQPPLRVTRAVYSVLADGRRIAVLSTREALDPMPDNRVIRLPDAGWPALLERLARETAPFPPEAFRLIQSDAELAADHDEITERNRLHQFARGHYVPVTGEELEKAQRLVALVKSGQLTLPDPVAQGRVRGRRYGAILFVVILFLLIALFYLKSIGR